MKRLTNKCKDGIVERGNSTLALKAGFWYMIGNFSAKAVAFITTPIFARLMIPFYYGEFMNFAGWVQILSLAVGVELFETLNRAYYDFKEDYDSYISSVTFLGCAITFCFYTVFLLFQDFILKIITIPKEFIHLLFLFLLFSFCRSVFYARERALYKYKSVAFITFISLFIPTLLSALLVYFLPENKQLSARLYGFYLTSAFIGMYCAISLFSKSRVFKWSYCKYGLYLSIPLLMQYLSAQMLNSTNVIITKNVLGASEAALISIAASTTNILMVLFQAMSGALKTWIMDNLEINRIETVKNGSFLYFIFLALITILIVLFTPEVVYILGGDKYLGAISLVPGLVFATFIQAITIFFTIILTYDKNVKATAFYTAIVSIIGIIVKVFFLSDNGLISLVVINVLVFFALFMINYLLVNKAVFSEYLYRFSAIRYTCIIFFIVASIFTGLLKRNMIDEMLNK